MQTSSLILTLKRSQPNVSWGFRMAGGKEFRSALTIQKVNPGSLSDLAGVKDGDQIIKIGGESTGNMTHKDAQAKIMQCGNYVEMEVARGFKYVFPDIPTQPIEYESANHDGMAKITISNSDSKPENSAFGSLPIRATPIESIKVDYSNKPWNQPKPESKPQQPAIAKKPETSGPTPTSINDYMIKKSDLAIRPDRFSVSDQPTEYNDSPKQEAKRTHINVSDYLAQKGDQPVPETTPNTITKTYSANSKNDDDVKNINSFGNAKAVSDGPPICTVCSVAIRGAYVTALGKIYCNQHFICYHCSEPLSNSGFIEEQGQVYCIRCHSDLFAPKCPSCNKPVVGKILNALNGSWHPECFICTHCRRPIVGGSFRTENNKPYCAQDWDELFGIKCSKCKKSIEANDKYIEALGKVFHTNCFTCTVCDVKLQGTPFCAINNEPYCRIHARPE